MRCYFMKGGHIAAVEILEGLTEPEAIEKSKSLFAKTGNKFDGFELWDGARVIMQHNKMPGDPEP